MTVGSLFSWIGGFDLGFERAGFEIRWQVEIDPFCRRVLEKHWPGIKRYADIRTLHAPEPAYVDVICGGFPCQPVSDNGTKGRQRDARWLWPEFARLIRELRPRYVVVENVAGLRRGGMGDLLGDLAAIGFDAEWESVPAAAFGAPHGRDRVWLVAYPHVPGCQRTHEAIRPRGPQEAALVSAGTGQWGPQAMWPPEPPVDRMVHGLPDRLARRDNECGIASFGNSIVPAIGEWLARRILAAAPPGSEPEK